jgi:glutaredoxin
MRSCPDRSLPTRRRSLTARAALLAGVLGLAATPALALYKVVGPDGRITYTDRPPAETSGRVIDLGARTIAAPDNGGDGSLPLALRQVVSRYPVVLFSAADCTACNSGRQMLQERGVPFDERSIVTEDDAAALERTVGARTVPALTVGSQALRGYSRNDWTAYLDAAGYPRESRLPPGWQPPVATPLVERKLVPAPRPAAPEAAPAPPPAPAPTPPSDIRF